MLSHSAGARSKLAFVLGLLIGIAVGFVAGSWFGEAKGNQGAYHLIFLMQKAEIESLLGGAPEYADVVFEESSQGDAYLTGSLPTKDSYERLLREMKKLGERRGERLTNVKIVAK